MKLARTLVLTAVMLQGCRTAHDVAASSYRVATTPVEFVRDRVRPPAENTPSDVTNPGQSVTPTASPSRRQKIAAQNSTPTKTTAVEEKPKPTPGSRVVAPPLQFPTAKPVEGKPGYVYSPSDPSKYVDVSGYAPGSKVKDPYSGQIFLVP